MAFLFPNEQSTLFIRQYLKGNVVLKNAFVIFGFRKKCSDLFVATEGSCSSTSDVFPCLSIWFNVQKHGFNPNSNINIRTTSFTPIFNIQKDDYATYVLFWYIILETGFYNRDKKCIIIINSSSYKLWLKLKISLNSTIHAIKQKGKISDDVMWQTPQTKGNA